MSQVLVCFDPETQSVDFAEDDNGFISLEGGLETAVLYSLLSNARAPDSAEEFRNQPFGWWGDDFADVEGDRWGSLIWTVLGRAKLSTQDIRNTQVFAEDGMRWLVLDAAARSVEVVPERIDPDTIRLVISVNEPDGNTWNEVWEVHRNAVRGNL